MSRRNFLEQPVAVAMDGSEVVPIIQSGTNKRTTTADIAALASTGISVVASDVSFTPTGGVSSTNVQSAIAELDSEKQAHSSVLDATTASFTTAYETKLSGIEENADVTDATNVAAAGAIMDGDFSSNGMMARTGAGAYASRTLSNGTGISISNASGASGNPSIALSSGSQASLALADTAVQPGDLGSLASKSQVDIADIAATGTPGNTTYLRGDGTWATPAGGGGGISAVVDDTAPQLGGDLDLNGNDITGTGDINITGGITISSDLNVDGGADVALDLLVGGYYDGQGGARITGGALPTQFASAGIYLGTETNGNEQFNIISSGTYGYFDIGGINEDYKLRFLTHIATGNTNLQALGTLSFTAGSGTIDFNRDVVVPDEAYDPSAWNGVLEVPTKNAIRDMIETLTGTTLPGAYQPLDSDLTSWAGVTRASGFDAFAVTPSSANLASLVTNETGSGALVFATSPTLVTPTLGVATATSVTVGNTGLTVGSSTPFSDSSGTLTLQNVDAIDATTESTIEAAIDTLANLTSIQGRSFTMGAYAPTVLNTANEAGFKAAVNLETGVDVQAYSARLADIAGLAVTDSNIIVGNGSAWVAESGATARTSLGLGTLATASNINDSNWSGTDLSVPNGGTGVSSTTAYAVLCGGTTSTDPLQSIASVGTSGQVLTSNGAGALPTFQDAAGGGWTEIRSTTVSSAVASVEFSGSWPHKVLRVSGSGVSVSTGSNVNLALSVSDDNGSTWETIIGAGSYLSSTTTVVNSNSLLSGTGLPIGQCIANSNTISFAVDIIDCDTNSRAKVLMGTGAYSVTAPFCCGGETAACNAINRVRIRFASGNIDAGTIILCGA